MLFLILLFSIFTLIAVFLLYLSNKHQKLINKPLPKRVRLIAYLLLLVAFLLININLSLSGSIFTSLMVLMLSVISVPLVGLWLKREKA